MKEVRKMEEAGRMRKVHEGERGRMGKERKGKERDGKKGKD